MCCLSEVTPSLPDLARMTASLAPQHVNRPICVLAGEVRKGHAARDTAITVIACSQGTLT